MSDLKLTVSGWGSVALDKVEIRKLMRSAANDIKTKTARLINKSQGGGRAYYGPSGRYTASTPGAPPVRVSGDLRGSLKTYLFPSGEGFAVRAREFYALFLETGAYGGSRTSSRQRQHRRLTASVRQSRASLRNERRVMEPRPFLDRVMDKEEADLERRVRLAFEKGLTWKQTK